MPAPAARVDGEPPMNYAETRLKHCEVLKRRCEYLMACIVGRHGRPRRTPARLQQTSYPQQRKTRPQRLAINLLPRPALTDFIYAKDPLDAALHDANRGRT